MLAVVKAPRTRNTKKTAFRVEGDIPDSVLEFLKREFPDSVEIENDDNGYTKLEDWDWYKEITERMTAGDAVKADRRLRGWTQKELAGRLGISVQNLSEIERDVRPVSRKMAAKLAAVFNTDPAAYFRFTKPAV